MLVQLETVVAGKHDDRGVGEVEHLQRVQQLADIEVGHRDHRVVRGDRLLELALGVLDVVGGQLERGCRQVVGVVRRRRRQFDLGGGMLLEELHVAEDVRADLRAAHSLGARGRAKFLKMPRDEHLDQGLPRDAQTRRFAIQ